MRKGGCVCVCVLCSLSIWCGIGPPELLSNQRMTLVDVTGDDLSELSAQRTAQSPPLMFKAKLLNHAESRQLDVLGLTVAIATAALSTESRLEVVDSTEVKKKRH